MLIILSVVVFFVLALNTQFTPWPEMLLWPYLINHGWLPYRDIAIAHSPLLVVIIAKFYKLLSADIVTLKLFSWLLIISNSLLLYFVSKKIFPKINSSLVIFFYIVLIFRYEGNGVWFDQALVAPGLLLYYFLSTKKYFYAGICFGISLAVKQTGIWFILPSLLFFPNLFRFAKGALIVMIAWWGSLLFFGVFQDYWYWSIKFGLGVLPHMPGRPSLFQFAQAALPFTTFIIVPWLKDHRWSTIVLVAWAITASFGAYPRWGLFHFQPALPFLALALVSISKSVSGKKRLLFYLTIFLFFIDSTRYFWHFWRLPDRFMEPEFVSAVNVAKNTSGPILNINWWDSIYVLSEKLPPRPWVPQLSWYLDQPGIRQYLENTDPVLLVYYPGADPELIEYYSSSFAIPPADCISGCTIERLPRLAN